MVLLILWQIFTCNTVRYFFHHRYGLGIISLNYIPHWCHSCHSYQRPRFHLHDRHPKDISTWRSPPEWKERSKSTWSHGHSSWRKRPDHVRLYFTWLADDQWSWHGLMISDHGMVVKSPESWSRRPHIWRRSTTVETWVKISFLVVFCRMRSLSDIEKSTHMVAWW